MKFLYLFTLIIILLNFLFVESFQRGKVNAHKKRKDSGHNYGGGVLREYLKKKNKYSAAKTDKYVATVKDKNNIRKKLK